MLEDCISPALIRLNKSYYAKRAITSFFKSYPCNDLIEVKSVSIRREKYQTSNGLIEHVPREMLINDGLIEV